MVIAIAIALFILGFLLAPLMDANALEHLGISLLLSGLVLGVIVWLGQTAFLSPTRELRLIDLEEESAKSGFRLVRDTGVVLPLIAVIAALAIEAGMLGPASCLASSLLVVIGSSSSGGWGH